MTSEAEGSGHEGTSQLKQEIISEASSEDLYMLVAGEVLKEAQRLQELGDKTVTVHRRCLRRSQNPNGSEVKFRIGFEQQEEVVKQVAVRLSHASDGQELITVYRQDRVGNFLPNEKDEKGDWTTGALEVSPQNFPQVLRDAVDSTASARRSMDPYHRWYEWELYADEVNREIDIIDITNRII